LCGGSCVASVVTEQNGTIAWVWNEAILYAFAGLQTLQSLHFCKVLLRWGKHTDCEMELCGGLVEWRAGTTLAGILGCSGCYVEKRNSTY
jgi:hypothetical protein